MLKKSPILNCVNNVKVIRLQRSGIDTIKYHTWPRIPMGKWQTHRRHHKREPRGQPFPSRWPQSTYPSGRSNWIKMIDSRNNIKLKTRIKLEITDILIRFSLPLNSNKLTEYISYVTCWWFALLISIVSYPKSLRTTQLRFQLYHSWFW